MILILIFIKFPLLQDTAGSERYEAMSRIYYRGAKAAVLCYGKDLLHSGKLEMFLQFLEKFDSLR